ncbi:MAG: type II secretion system F family protein [Candidatus Omnitrophota bacterium]
MANFKYTVKNINGDTLKGALEALDTKEAQAILHKKDLTIISLIEEKSKLVAKKTIKLDQLAGFARQLATLVDSGIPLVQALLILSEQTDNKYLASIILKIKQDIEQGINFCDALKKHPAIFSELFVNMAKAGEASGMLNAVLERLATYLEKTASFIRKVKSALVYPVLVIIIAIGITSFLLIKVVPTFKGIFEMLGGTLPMPTKILIAASDLLRYNFLLTVIILIISAFLFKKYVNTEKGKYNFHKIILKAPIFGPLFRNMAVAKFSRTFSTLVKSGVPILTALEIVSKTSGNKIVEEAIEKSRVSIKEGEPIAKPLMESRIFPPMVTRMISVGEQTGELEKMLGKIADFYEEQVDITLANLSNMIEPLVIVFLGTVIGGIVVALFLPIFKITSLISA